MPSSVEAAKYFNEQNKRVASLGAEIDAILEGEGCASYVKTIYVGYDIDGVMVAALYARGDHIELALALDENHTADMLIDASHLTWRTLPLAAIIRSKADVVKVDVLISEACARIRGGTHSVNRDNDFFVKSRRERRGR